mgnify:CR=1 FL=1
MTTKIIELIYTETKLGKGTSDDPSRISKQLYTKDGKLVADSCSAPKAGMEEWEASPVFIQGNLDV